jgi:hypothetical protein
VFPISRAAAAARVTKPALLNYIHRGLVTHGGESPANGSARQIPLLGIYEAAWIGALGRVGIGPSVAAALFPLLRQHVLDRNCDDPLLAILAVEQETPAIEIVRGWSSATNTAARLPSMVSSPSSICPPCSAAWTPPFTRPRRRTMRPEDEHLYEHQTRLGAFLQQRHTPSIATLPDPAEVYARRAADIARSQKERWS